MITRFGQLRLASFRWVLLLGAFWLVGSKESLGQVQISQLGASEQQLLELASLAASATHLAPTQLHQSHQQNHQDQNQHQYQHQHQHQQSQYYYQPTQQISAKSASDSTIAGLTIRSRSPRSIGEMFKKLFNGNKRSKQTQANRNEWDQQQAQTTSQQQQQQQHHHQQQQQQQLQHQLQLHQQHQQSQAMAAQIAAAAANQHAVYASPFAYTAQSSSMYPQFAPYSSAGLLAWPAGLAQALRSTPTLAIGPASAPTVALASSPAGALYAAASQSYNSYAAPPVSSTPGASGAQQVGGTGASSGTQAGPVAAASHAHPSAVAPPGAHSAGPAANSLDFHQVLDALVRTSGFTPAGDQEAAYGPKSDGTPVFSFRKLVSLPFYLSTEEKSLDGLAGALGPSAAAAAPAGYSLHSMPIMRRHVRRMSASGQQQQQVNQANQQQQQQQQQSQLQLGQFLGPPDSAGDVAAALANYQALAALASQPSKPLAGRQSAVAAAAAAASQLAAASSAPSISAQAAPMYQTSDIQALLNQLNQQQQQQPVDFFPDGHRLGNLNQANLQQSQMNQQQQHQYLWPMMGPTSNEPLATAASEQSQQQHQQGSLQPEAILVASRQDQTNGMQASVANASHQARHQAREREISSSGALQHLSSAPNANPNGNQMNSSSISATSNNQNSINNNGSQQGASSIFAPASDGSQQQ